MYQFRILTMLAGIISASTPIILLLLQSQYLILAFLITKIATAGALACLILLCSKAVHKNTGEYIVDDNTLLGHLIQKRQGTQDFCGIYANLFAFTMTLITLAWFMVVAIVLAAGALYLCNMFLGWKGVLGILLSVGVLCSHKTSRKFLWKILKLTLCLCIVIAVVGGVAVSLYISPVDFIINIVLAVLLLSVVWVIITMALTWEHWSNTTPGKLLAPIKKLTCR